MDMWMNNDVRRRYICWTGTHMHKFKWHCFLWTWETDFRFGFLILQSYNRMDNLLFIFFLLSCFLSFYQRISLQIKMKIAVIFLTFACIDLMRWNVCVCVSITLIAGRKRIESHKSNRQFKKSIWWIEYWISSC